MFKKKKMSFGKKLTIIKVSAILFLVLVLMSIPQALFSKNDFEIKGIGADLYNCDIEAQVDSAASSDEDLDYLIDGDADFLIEDDGEYEKVLKNLADAVKKRVEERQNQIASAIENKRGEIEAAVKSASGADAVVITIDKTPITQLDALKIIALHSVQYEDAGLVSKGDLLKYVGRRAIGSISVPLSDFGISISVPKWGGTFIPQYLLEAQVQTQDKLGKQVLSPKAAAVADILIYIDCPSISSVLITDVVETKTEEAPPENIGGSEAANVVKDADGGSGSENSDAGEESNEPVITKTAYVNIIISTRDVDELADIAGLIDRFEAKADETDD